jgi:hypothetical protein
MAVALLTFVALWPLAHRGLVAHFDVNPWKLSGFAMYTTPTPPILVVLMIEDSTRPAALRPLREADLPAHTREALDDFRRTRHALGHLTRPDAAARSVLRARQGLAHVLVVVQRMWLDPATATMDSDKQTYLYDRSAVGEDL